MTQLFLSQLRRIVEDEAVTPYQFTVTRQAADFKLSIFFKGKRPPITFAPTERSASEQINNLVSTLEAEFSFQHNPVHDEFSRSWWAK